MADTDAAASSGRHRLTIRPHHSADVCDHASPSTVTCSADDQRAARKRCSSIRCSRPGRWDEPVGSGQLDIGLIPGVTDTAAAQVVHAAALLGIGVDDASVGRLIDLGRPAPTIPRSGAGGPTPSSSGGRRAARSSPASPPRSAAPRSPSTSPCPTTTKTLAAARPRARPGARPRRAARHPRALRRASAATRPTPSWRRSPRPGASTARTRASAPTSSSTTARSPNRCSPGCAARTDRDRRAVRGLARSTATPASSSSTTHRTYALKCETHNHPSAIEPFGGANTGVGGVIRDIIGAHHRAIACTNILCFGPGRHARRRPARRRARPAAHHRRRRRRRRRLRQQDRPPDRRRRRALRPGLRVEPARVRRLHRRRRRPAGRRSPGRTPATGSSSSVAAPAATASAAPRSRRWRWTPPPATSPAPACRSATRSSRSSSAICSIDAWDLYSAITDCGAGGLSSAIGELAERIGAEVELTKVPLKYAGLAPWEIWLSEAQERMVVAVAPDAGRRAGRAGRAARRRAERRRLVHRRRPTRRALRRRAGHRARHDVPPRRTAAAPTAGDAADADALDARVTAVATSICASSAARAARPSQHRQQGADHPPLRPRDPRVDRRAPADRRAATTRRPTVSSSPTRPTTDGIAIGIGVNPWYGLHDPEHMAWAVVDEAIRNVVVAGADPDRGRADGQLLVGQPDPADDVRRAGRRRCRVASTPPTPTARRSCPARTR